MADCPTPRHTVSTVRGAQAGFLLHGLLLHVPTNLEHGATARRCTPRRGARPGVSRALNVRDAAAEEETTGGYGLEHGSQRCPIRGIMRLVSLSNTLTIDDFRSTSSRAVFGQAQHTVVFIQQCHRHCPKFFRFCSRQSKVAMSRSGTSVRRGVKPRGIFGGYTAAFGLPAKLFNMIMFCNG